MKDFIFLFVGLLGMIAFGQAMGPNVPSEGKFEIEYKDKTFQQKFTLVAGDNPTLALQQSKQKAKSQKLKSLEADEISSDLTHIYWEALTKQEKCTKFATIRLPGEKTLEVCREDSNAQGKLYGLMSKLTKRF